jgi:hypothetical protein
VCMCVSERCVGKPQVSDLHKSRGWNIKFSLKLSLFYSTQNSVWLSTQYKELHMSPTFQNLIQTQFVENKYVLFISRFDFTETYHKFILLFYNFMTLGMKLQPANKIIGGNFYYILK